MKCFQYESFSSKQNYISHYKRMNGGNYWYIVEEEVYCRISPLSNSVNVGNNKVFEYYKKEQHEIISVTHLQFLRAVNQVETYDHFG